MMISLTALFLVATSALLCQTPGRILPVAGLGPNYEPKPAKEAFLFGTKRLLSAGPNGFYVLEPNSRVIRVDNDGILQPFATVTGLETLRDTDAAGNYFFSNGTSILRTDTLGNQSILFNFFSLDSTTAALVRNPIGLAVNRGGASVLLTSSQGAFTFPGPTTAGLPDARSSPRLHFTANNSVVFIDASTRRLFLRGDRLAGSGEFGEPIDGEPALGTKFRSLADVTSNATGSIVVLDRVLGAAYRIDDGKIWRMAGGGESPPDEGIAAREAKLVSADSIAFDNEGRLLIADSGTFTVWRVEADGTLTRAAGRPRGITSRALESSFGQLTGLAYDVSSNLYTVDKAGFRIYRISPDGELEIAAGTGSRETNGDGDSALDTASSQKVMIHCRVLIRVPEAPLVIA